MKKPTAILLCLAMVISLSTFAQVAINNSGSPPDSSAILDIQSSNKGLLIPRLTQNQIEDIQSPANGLIVFNVENNRVYIYLEMFDTWQSLNFGAEVLFTFICGEPIQDPRDGKTYKTMQIGEQCWMRDNLNIGTRVDSTVTQTDNETVEKYCYRDTEDSCDVHGGLYQWDEMMSYTSDTSAQGICPAGWHIPSDYEWELLEGTVDSLYAVGDPEWDKIGYRGYDAGKVLKDSSGSWHCYCHTGDDSYRFTALPSGARDIYSNYFGYEYSAYFWTSTAEGVELARIRDMHTYQSKIGRSDTFKETGASVRCLRD